MGVPKFYRWISERYPCLSEIVKENQIPEFDNLYLDMNGIIHTCSHPNDDDPHFRITEEHIFRDIFRYIEVLFRIIRPRKVFFMAVDGVAPRAKMNQQRGRRFMSARTAEELIEQAKKKGEKLPSEERFDSNCITPGTHFMARLHEQLKYFVNMKITTDEMWQGIRIYLSGHDVPGEGEHKIMDFIRYERSQPGYDCNTRHCLYGLDADLIMLGMCSHEPYFALLREEVKFVRPSRKGNQRTSNAEQTTFHLLHLSLLRDYIELEFGGAKESLPFEFDVESIIDDWVLMGFLVGNDFIPHLPNLHIHANALPNLYKAYKKVLPGLGGYINEKGYLNLPRFEKFMSTLVQFDRDFFEDEYEDCKWLESKTSAARFGSRDIRKNVPRYIVGGAKELVPYTDSEPEAVGVGSLGEENACSGGFSEPRKERSGSSNSDDISHMPDELQDLIRRSNADCKNSDTSGDDEEEEEDVQDVAVEMKSPVPIVDYECVDDDDDSWSPDMEKKFKAFKSDYYMSKMRFARITPEVLHDQAVQYVRAIQWNLHYYYNGICSWSWYYPHHYAPYLSDVKGFSNLDINFELGEPFLPFQQLLAVLPAASKKLLPTAYQSLMTNSESPLIDFYPSEFCTDLNGKKNDWEAVILIPFIEEARLLKAMSPMSALLTDEEKARNRPGKHLLYTTAAQDQGFYRTPLMGIFPDLEHNKAICTQLDAPVFRLPPSKIRRGLLPGVRLDMYFLGFSTLKHLAHVGELTSLGVKVFEQQSKNDSTLIKLLDDQRCHQSVEEAAKNLLGKEVYVNWPHLTVGLVSAVSSGKEKYVKEKESGELARVPMTTKEMRTWIEHAEEIRTKYATHRAVEIGDVTMLAYVNRLMGRKYACNQRGQISLDKQWGDLALPYALQTVVENVNVRDTVLSGKFSRVDDLYPVESKVFLISNPFYGCHGRVVQLFDEEKGRLRVEVTVKAEPDFSRLKANQERIGLFWYPGWQAAQKLDVSGHFLSRITGTVYMTENAAPASGTGSNSSGNRYNIGLNLKFSKKNEEVPDYTKRDADGVWLYSSKVLKILGDYIQKFQEVCDVLHGQDGRRDVFSAEDFWDPAQSKQKLTELLEWLKSLPSYGAQHQATGTECVDERVIRAMETAVEKTKQLRKKEVKLVGVRPNALFRSCLSEGNASPDSRADFQLFDRVVCAREGFTVPIGLRGTVVGIHPGRQEGDLKLSVIFDEEFIGGINIRNSKCSGYHIMASALINLSYGVRLAEEKKKEKQPAQQQQQAGWQYQPMAGAPYGQYAHDHRDDWNAPQRPIQNRRPEALQMAPPQAVVTKSVHSAFHIAQRGGGAAGTSEQQTVRPASQKSVPDSHRATYSKVLQGGKSIINEIFPNRAAEEPKPGEVVFVNSSMKKEKKTDLEESTHVLLSLLRVGDAKESESKKRTETRGKNGRSTREEQRRQGQQISQAPTKPQEPRVPFTARQPQPPPFAPTFSPDASPVAVVPPHPQPELQQGQLEKALVAPCSVVPAPQPPALVPMHLFQPRQIPVTSMVQQHEVRPPVQIVTPIPQMHPHPQQQFVGQAHQISHPPPMLPPSAPLPYSQIVLPNTTLPVGQQQQQQLLHMHQLQQLHQQKLQQLQQIQQQQQMQQQQLRGIQANQLHQQYPQQMQQRLPPHQHRQYHQQPQTAPKQQQQHYRDANAMGQQGRQRRISNSTAAGGGHEFVPMQVTKKQPAPAYVKNIAAKAATETAKTVESPRAVENKDTSRVGQHVSATTGNADGHKNQTANAGGTKPRQQPTADGMATRPKSRLAVKLAPAN